MAFLMAAMWPDTSPTKKIKKHLNMKKGEGEREREREREEKADTEESYE